MDSFTSLDDATQAAIRETQRQRKQEKLQAKKQKQQKQPPVAAAAASDEKDYPTLITEEAYFGACSGGRFRDPKLPPCDEALALLLRVLDAGDEQAKSLSSCHYFQFSGPAAAQWKPRFNARLAWEGFFTITARTGPGRTIEPLPELQPFYSVVTWPNFEAAKHVRQTLKRLRAGGGRGYRLVCVSDGRAERLWRLVDEYHRAQHGSNWLCREYFDMMRAASDDPAINFRMHCIELHAADEPEEEEPSADATMAVAEAPAAAAVAEAAEAAEAAAVAVGAAGASSSGAALPARTPLAGEIGFSVGGVYTSLSGWTGERSHESVGTAQLVLLGRWLQARGYGFWSLGHCYSPQMDYKRQLGHRIYPRDDFRQLLRRHRGPFELGGGGGGGSGDGDGDGGGGSLDGGGEGGAKQRAATLEPLGNGDAVGEAELLSLQAQQASQQRGSTVVTFA